MWTRVILLCLFGQVSFGQMPTNEHLIDAKQAPTEANVDTLEYVQVMWRHGDRTPATVFQPEETKNWPMGLGELTREGMAQHYRLGKWLRMRYGRFLQDRFDRAEIYVRSSDYNRTLMSALANMAGLFPPQAGEVWDEKMPWQPVPVHTVPKLIDKALYEDIPCPRGDEETKKIYSSPAARKIEEENKNFLSFLAQKTNTTDTGLGAMWKVYDELNCQYHHNQTHHWPEWVTPAVFEKVMYLYDVGSRFKFHTEFLRRIRGGPLLDEMYHRFKDKFEGRLGDRPKFYAYSAHDTTLAAFLATLGIYPERFPLYATAIIMELHRIDGRPVVQLFRKNITDSNLLYLTEIPGCREPCTLDKLHSVMSLYIPENWEAECGYKDGPVSLGPYIAAIVVLSFTTLLLGGILVLDIFLKHRKKSSERQSVLLINEDEEES